MTGTAVFLISAATLAFEVLLARIFSISQWNHLSFMVISIALFGFAASGTLLGIRGERRNLWIDRFSKPEGQLILSAGFSVTALVAYVVLVTIPLDYFRLPVEPEQFLYLLTAYLTLICPFFFAGLLIIIAYAANPAASGRTYFANMSGSATGAMYPALMLPYLDESQLSLVSVGLPFLVLLPAAAYHMRQSSRQTRNWHRYGFGGLWLVLAGFIGFGFVHGSWFEIRISPYKALAQTLQMPDTLISGTKNDLKGRFDRVESPYIRYGPGLSLKFNGRLPLQNAVFRDGENRLVLYDIPESREWDFATRTLSYLGYSLLKKPTSVLILQNGGGIAIPCALASGAERITIVEPHAAPAGIIREHYRIPVVHQPHRVFLARAEDKFDLIHIENWGSSLPGTAALSQDYSFTRDSIKQYLDHLKKDGLLIFSRMLMLPPSDSIRLWATIYESMVDLGFPSPQRHIAVLRNWDTYTVLVAKNPFNNPQRIKNLADRLNFDVVFLEELSPASPNRYNVFNQPFHHRSLNLLWSSYQSGRQDDFFREYPMDVRPQDDTRPFPARVLKWTRLKDLYKSTGSRMYTLLLSGEIVVAVVFFQALGITAVLILLPLLYRRADRSIATGSNTLYFAAIGIGFMAVEFYFLKQFVLICGDPVTSFAVVLTGMLVFSGLGGMLSQKIASRHMPAVLFTVALSIAAYLSVQQYFLNSLVSQSIFWRLTGAMVLLAPAGIVTGLPFPLGMRYLLNSSAQRSYAWTINGCTSVLSSILAAQIAISLGIPALMAAAAGAYFFAWISIARRGMLINDGN